MPGICPHDCVNAPFGVRHTRYGKRDALFVDEGPDARRLRAVQDLEVALLRKGPFTRRGSVVETGFGYFLEAFGHRESLRRAAPEADGEFLGLPLWGCCEAGD